MSILSRVFIGTQAINEGERYGLLLLEKNPSLAVWLPLAYHIADFEFKNPDNVVFEYNYFLDRVVKHTEFSRFIFELVYFLDLRNLPVRSITNGIGSTNAASFLFAVYAGLLYLRIDPSS